jgi:VIT1/CCC1 family predicted Fe2+/Mn2+ transporter
LLEDVVNVIVSKRKVWLDTIKKEKLGLIEDKNENTLSKAITTFGALNLVGFVLLTPFVFVYFSDFASLMAMEHIFIYSILFIAVSFFLIGLIKGRVVDKSPIKSGLNTIMIGAIATSVAFLGGSLLSDPVIH